MSAYDSYEENCVADREGCPTLLFKPTSEGCHRCSNSYKYTYAKWDNPGTDGECFTEDDLYDKATYTCNCSCTANGSLTSEGQWVDSSSGRTSYSDCVKYCDSLK